MQEIPTWAKVTVWAGIVLAFLIIGLLSKLPTVAAFGWDWRCVFVECRLTH